MKYLTAQYRREKCRDALVVQHYEYAGEQICFACAASWDGWAEELYFWFRNEVLGKGGRNRNRALKEIEQSLRRHLKKLWQKDSDETLAGEYRGLAGVLCLGESFLGFEQGGMRVFCLNTAFGRGHLEVLGEDAIQPEIYSGTLQEDVALLIINTELVSRLGERELSEGLFVGEVRREWQMYRHLRELVNSARAEDLDGSAIMVRSYSQGTELTSRIKEMEGTLSEDCFPDEAMMRGEKTQEVPKMPEIHGRWKHRLRNQFALGEMLGEGAFAKVYKVQDYKNGKIYACKQSTDIAVLCKEYCLGRELEHPLFPRMYDFWQEDGMGFLLMEYVPGNTIKELLRNRGAFSVRQTTRVGMELAGGLLYLHERKVPCLFRDVKPDNILIRQDGRVKLLDLGCVCTIGAGEKSLAGSPGYAAPEQLHSGMRQDVTCDVYGVAKTMEEMLAGGRQKGKEKRREKRQRLRLMQIIRHCTAEDVTCRIPDMRWLLQMLAQLQGRECGSKILFCGKTFRCLKNIWIRSTESS